MSRGGSLTPGWRRNAAVRGNTSYRRRHEQRVTKRPRCAAHQDGDFARSWCGWPVIDGSTSRGCPLFMHGPLGMYVLVILSDVLSRVNRSLPLYPRKRISGTPWCTYLLLSSNSGETDRVGGAVKQGSACPAGRRHVGREPRSWGSRPSPSAGSDPWPRRPTAGEPTAVRGVAGHASCARAVRAPAPGGSRGWRVLGRTDPRAVGPLCGRVASVWARRSRHARPGTPLARPDLGARLTPLPGGTHPLTGTAP